jgi:hypothetical protein
VFSSNPGTAILLVVFLVGALIFALGTLLVRRERLRKDAPQPSVEPVKTVDPYERIEALLTLSDASSVRELERLRDSGATSEIRAAAEDALIVIASRA